MTPESTIGPYRILSKLGEGGMGQVWRARDPRLNRDVAIKVLPPALANDAQYMARFEREAQTLAAVNHPNIAHVYGIEQGALVMELVEGPDLHGPLPFDTAVAYALQIAAGLEAAHEKGIVHRDLKPANIKVTPEGVVKILDFGLAKSAVETPAAASATISPTLSLAMTQAGMILGTAAYMAPEQARGKPVDKRADIWALGVVLYEMLTGRQLFGGGETITDTLASVVKDTPDLNALPAGTPPNVRRLIERCLRKDPQTRLRDIGEARVALSEPEAPATEPPRIVPPRAARLPWVVAAAAFILAAAAVGYVGLRPRPAASATLRFLIPPPDGTVEGTAPAGAQAAPSPDGRLVAFVASSDQRNWLWLRPVSSFDSHRLDRTEGANFPFWSPDGKFIAFFTEDKLKKIPAAGGVAQVVCDVPRPSASRTNGDGGTWNDDGTIIFANSSTTPLMRVSSSGGTPTPVTRLDETAGERGHTWPQFLPGGRHLLYLAVNRDTRQSAVYVQDVVSGARTLVVKTPVRAVYDPSGFLLYVRDQALFAQRMDPKTFRLSGEPEQIVEDIMTNPVLGRASFAIAGNVLAYRTGFSARNAQLVWYDRTGKRGPAVGQPASYVWARVSPDGRSAAVLIGRPGNTDAWTLDLTSGALTRLSASGEIYTLGPWSPDSRKLLLNQIPGRPVLEAVPGTGAVRELAGRLCTASDWSPDGRAIVCSKADTGILSFPPDAGEAQVLTDSRGLYGRISPDGKRIVYATAQPGSFQITVAAFPSFADRRQVSVAGGTYPEWGQDGRELYFAAGNTLMSVEIRPGERVDAGVPKALFQVPSVAGPALGFSRAPDGRFLVIERDRSGEQSLVNVVVNWAAELRQ